MKVNNIYVVVSNGLFKDSYEEDNYPGVDLNSQTIMLKSRRAERERTMTIHAGQAGMQAFGEALHREIERQLDSVPIIYGTAGESQVENEQMWADLRNESIEARYNPLLDTQPPTEEYIVGLDPYTQIQDRDNITTTRNMTEQEIINYFDTISNEE